MKYLLTIAVKDASGKGTFVVQEYKSMFKVIDDLIQVMKIYKVLNVTITNLESNND